MVRHMLEFNGSYRSMENMGQIVNTTPNASVNVPCTKYKLKKLLQPIFATEIHIKCNQCSNYNPSAKSATLCESCEIPINTTKSDYFIYISIREQIAKSVNCNIDEILTYYAAASEKNEMTDIHNALSFKRFQEKYPNFIILPLIFNVDGVKTYKSSAGSLWLRQIYQYYLSPKQRFQSANIMIVAAHFGKQKPIMKDFLYPFMNDIRVIDESGGIQATHDGKIHR